jgi:hypothetical protein
VTFIFTCKTCNNKFRLSEDEKHVFFEMAKKYGAQKVLDLRCPACFNAVPKKASRAKKAALLQKGEPKNAIQD